MARARNIKPGFFTNDVLAQCGYGARLLFAGLWTIADREGRLDDKPVKIRALLFPYDKCDVEKWLDELAAKGFIKRYRVGSDNYIQVNNFRKHQNPHVKEAPSTIPAPDSSEASREISGASPADSLLPITDSLSTTQSGASTARESFKPPSLEEVAAYCEERGNNIDPEAFVAHYSAIGWMVGKARMKNWHAAITTWERRRANEPKRDSIDELYPRMQPGGSKR